MPVRRLGRIGDQLQHKAFVAEGVGRGQRPELVGGGLIRSLGGWSQVLSLRKKGLRMAADDRVLSGSRTRKVSKARNNLTRRSLPYFH
jgi:putative transposase